MCNKSHLFGSIKDKGKKIKESCTAGFSLPVPPSE